MRSTLIGGLVANVATNLKRDRIAGACFRNRALLLPRSAGWPGRRFSSAVETHGAGLRHGFARTVGLCRAQGRLFRHQGGSRNACSPRSRPASRRPQHPALHPGRSARVLVAGKAIGFVGELHPQWQQKYELPLAAGALRSRSRCCHVMATLPQYVEVSRQPIVIRDMAIVVDQALDLQP
jgi:phenylalanyl-tRNA synthetase beta chain